MRTKEPEWINSPSDEEKTRILHVDDDETYLAILKTILLKEIPGIEITSMDDSREALARLKEGAGRFDILILDFQMPGVDGIELARMAKEIDEKIGIIMLTGKSREEVAINALNAGVDLYFQKDMKMDDLARELARVIKVFGEKRRKEIELERQHQITKILLDKVPHPVMLIRFSTKEILESNKYAMDAGAIPGTKCHAKIFGNLDVCNWCCAEEALGKEKVDTIVDSENDLYHCYWNRVEEDLYIHTIIPLNPYKEELIRILKSRNA